MLRAFPEVPREPFVQPGQEAVAHNDTLRAPGSRALKDQLAPSRLKRFIGPAGRHGRGNSTGRSPAPCRSARPRGQRAVRVDEGNHFLNGRSRSAWGKCADALRRISFP